MGREERRQVFEEEAVLVHQWGAVPLSELPGELSFERVYEQPE